MTLLKPQAMMPAVVKPMEKTQKRPNKKVAKTLIEGSEALAILLRSALAGSSAMNFLPSHAVMESSASSSTISAGT